MRLEQRCFPTVADLDIFKYKYKHKLEQGTKYVAGPFKTRSRLLALILLAFEIEIEAVGETHSSAFPKKSRHLKTLQNMQLRVSLNNML